MASTFELWMANSGSSEPRRRFSGKSPRADSLHADNLPEQQPKPLRGRVLFSKAIKAMKAKGKAKANAAPKKVRRPAKAAESEEPEDDAAPPNKKARGPAKEAAGPKSAEPEDGAAPPKTTRGRAKAAAGPAGAEPAKTNDADEEELRVQSKRKRLELVVNEEEKDLDLTPRGTSSVFPRGTPEAKAKGKGRPTKAADSSSTPEENAIMHFGQRIGWFIRNNGVRV